jgi:hypothetical protein
MSRVIGIFLLTALATPAVADDELLAGRSVVVRGGALLRVLAKPAAGARVALPGPESDPTVGGAVLRVLDLGLDGAGDDAYVLPAAGWTRRGPSDAPRSYRYHGAGTPDDPCRSVVVKPRAVKAVCKGAAVRLAPPFAGEVAVILSMAGEGTRYCATFGGATVQNRAGGARRRGAPVPAECGGCACGTPAPSRLAFTAGVVDGACGVLEGGTLNNELVCGGLYFGGGGGSTPVPARFPDFANPLLFRVSDCVGERLTLAATTAEEVGASRSCSAAGCVFGAPIPLPNPESVPTSTCLYNVIAADAAGSATCGGGDADVALPLRTEVYLNGDLLPNRCVGGTNPGGRCRPESVVTDCPGGGACEPDDGTQPCPICNPTTGVCNGGPRNNQPCVPDGDDLVGAPYPTSHDCPSSPLVRLGDLPIDLALTTGTVTRTAAPSGTQERVFCGYCRDAQDTGQFQGPPAVPCLSDADCAPPFSSCEQNHHGAFRNALATAITEEGSPAGALADRSARVSTLVSVFCIPPTFNGLIDASGDLPGPGALALGGTLQLQ